MTSQYSSSYLGWNHSHVCGHGWVWETALLVQAQLCCTFGALVKDGLGETTDSCICPSSSSRLAWAWSHGGGSKRMKRNMQYPLKPNLEQATMTSTFFCWPKQVPHPAQELEKEVLLPVGRPAKPHCKGWRYRERQRNGDIFAAVTYTMIMIKLRMIANSYSALDVYQKWCSRSITYVV